MRLGGLGGAALAMGTLGFAACLAAAPAVADGGRGHHGDSRILEVTVTPADAEFGDMDTIRIRGRNLLGRSWKEETGVMLGEQGALEVLFESDDLLVAHCFVDNTESGEPDFACAPGDYLLQVVHERRRRDGERKWKSNGHHWKHVAARYALTIGAAGEGGDPTNGSTGPAVKLGPAFETGRAGGAYLEEDLNEDGIRDWQAVNDPRVFAEGRNIRLGFQVSF